MKFYRIPRRNYYPLILRALCPSTYARTPDGATPLAPNTFYLSPPNQRELLKTAFLTAPFLFVRIGKYLRSGFLRCPNLRITDAGPHINSIVTEPSVRRALGRGGKTSAHMEHSPAACIICYRRLSSPPRRMRRTIKRNMTEVRNELSLQSFQ